MGIVLEFDCDITIYNWIIGVIGKIKYALHDLDGLMCVLEY